MQRLKEKGQRLNKMSLTKTGVNSSAPEGQCILLTRYVVANILICNVQDCAFDPQTDQTKDDTICIRCFFVKHASFING